MDFEAPVDAWYVWLGVTLVAAGLFGLVAALPTQPPPDADRMANAIDEVAGSSQTAEATIDHDATEIKIRSGSLAVRNEAGTERAVLRFGRLTPLAAFEDDSNRTVVGRLLAGDSPGDVIGDVDGLEDERDLRIAAGQARDRLDRDGATWRPTDGPISVRKLHIDGEEVVLIDA